MITLIIQHEWTEDGEPHSKTYFNKYETLRLALSDSVNAYANFHEWDVCDKRIKGTLKGIQAENGKVFLSEMDLQETAQAIHRLPINVRTIVLNALEEKN